ncbi:hypothetical protein [Thalassoroseus pseudoceratinae]|uniref:hypothetical protein n=1 Tax=Thalassoroseus pseudoceratinae TaxID=2713176 RepID=UPI00141FECB8|nr:hypothetical protein [Thalassoroseus pseudoceratinae]
MWFTETAWPPIMIAATIGVAFLLKWYSVQRPIYLITGGLFLVSCLVIYGVELSVVTEGEVVEGHVQGLTGAVVDGDIEKAQSYFADNPYGTAIKIALDRLLSSYDIENDLAITDFYVTTDEQEKEAVAHFRANGSVGGRGEVAMRSGPTRWELTWEKQSDGQWKVVQVQQLNPVDGTRVGWFDRYIR